MEKAYKNFTAFVTNAVNTCFSLLKVLLQSRFGLKFPAATTPSCILLGNGPSLNDSLRKHPVFFREHTLMCVNNFAATPEYVQLKPAYYVMLDPGYWSDHTEIVKKTMQGLIQDTTWKVTLLVPSKARSSAFFTEQLKQNPNIKLRFFNYTVFKGFDTVARFFYRRNLAMPQSQNVLVASLFVAINLGFREIYLTGADHTWHENLHVNENNQLCIKDAHFYERGTEVSYRPFYKDTAHTETFKMHEILGTLAKTFYGYEVMDRYAKSRGATIYNASDISFIDSFKRITPQA